MIFKLLLYFVVGYSIFRFLTSVFRPRRSQQQKYTQHKSNRREGDVAVNLDKSAKKDKLISKEDGDYIDYEEV